jgi:hypothetical protein
MRKQKSFLLVIFAALVLACLQAAALGQAANDGNLANVAGGGSSVKWDVVVQNSGGSITITAPDGRAFTREFRAGTSPEITLSDKQFDKLPDGVYSYELRLGPSFTAADRETLKAARGRDDEPEAERAARKRPVLPVLVQSGAFAIVNGAIVVGGAVEPKSNAKIAEPTRSPGVLSGNTLTRLRNHRMSLGAMPDFVIADDLIVQGSACVGLDCVNGEVFNFDTIRVKENNTRIGFMDTSSAAGFPTNDWTIRANDSANGGGNFLAFVDQGATSTGAETGTIVFEVDAGAPANSLRVSSAGRVGIKTATPLLDLHANNSNTPAFRLEQNSSGGFTAQTWDIAGNEANFFVRDVTGGSRLPFRIRPGAPTSSIDVNASGNVGIGTASPIGKLDIRDNGSGGVTMLLTDNNANTIVRARGIGTAGSQRGAVELFNANVLSSAIYSDANDSFINGGGRLGIGTAAPTDTLSVNGTASKPGGGTWAVFSDERLKNIKGHFNVGLKALMQLQPIRYEYKRDNALGIKSEGENIGFGAQALQKVLPEAVTTNSAGYLMVNSDPILWTMLNAIKEQQKEIAELKGQVQKLRAASHRRRK